MDSKSRPSAAYLSRNECARRAGERFLRDDKNPYFNQLEPDEDGYVDLIKKPDEKVVRRQDAPTVYSMNACVYAYDRDFLLQTNRILGEHTTVHVMPPELSVDIDRPIDLLWVEFLMD